jgi:hypothetical protein
MLTIRSTTLHCLTLADTTNPSDSGFAAILALTKSDIPSPFEAFHKVLLGGRLDNVHHMDLGVHDLNIHIDSSLMNSWRHLAQGRAALHLMMMLSVWVDPGPVQQLATLTKQILRSCQTMGKRN